MTIPKPPLDAELAIALAQMPKTMPTLTRDSIPLVREFLNQTMTAEVVTNAFPTVSHEEKTINGPNGDIILSIFRSKNSTAKTHPCIYWIHGGGMIAGNRFLGLPVVAEWIQVYNIVCISVEYRLAPENMAPVPVEDCYAGLKWVVDNVGPLGVDATKLMIAGQSAGGGLAAGVGLLARDRGGPALCAQLLMCPMLDDRNETVSSKQFYQTGSWTGENNSMAWQCLLGTEDSHVSTHSRPGRAKDLSGLPSTYIDVGSAETLRDEDVAYASRLWESGVQVELHVWPGAFHGSDMLCPQAALSQIANKTRTAWVGRIIS